jgi:hypothetical protein
MKTIKPMKKLKIRMNPMIALKNGCDDRKINFNKRKTNSSEKYCPKGLANNQFNNNENNVLYCGLKTNNSLITKWKLLTDNSLIDNKDQKWTYYFVVIGEGSAQFNINHISN